MKVNWNPWEAATWSVPESEWNNSTLPLITLGVLSYNRLEDLRRTLDVLSRAVQYPNYEILVIDNGSTDGSLDMVRAEYPQVLVHEVGENRGVSSRNIQAKLARGKYLFSFDDDSIPSSPASVLRMVKHMESHASIDALSTSCYRPLEGVEENRGWEIYRLGFNRDSGYEGIYIVEGGVCFRASSLRKLPGYDSALTYGSEGIELGLQLFKANAQIVLCPSFATLHFVSQTARIPGKRAYGNSRHMLWIVAKHWPWPVALPFLLAVVTRRLVAMVMHGDTLVQNASGLRDGFRGIAPYFKSRPKLKWKQVFRLKRFYLFFLRWA